MNPLRSERLRSVLVAVGAIGAVFWTILNTKPSFASNLSLTLTINGGSNAISLDIASLSPNGTFRNSSTDNNITVTTNNYTGYTLGILAKAVNVGDTTHSNALSYTASGTTYTIPSITTAVSQSNYSDDAYAEANSLNNTWGYRPSTLYDSTNDTNVSNTDYLPAPTSTETANQTIIAKTTSANTSGSTDGYNIAIGARVNNDTPPGTYSNTFVITVVANNISYTINYDANAGSDTVTNMPTTPQQEVVDATIPTITLPSNKPTRDGYAFKGWCTVQVADDAACSGTEYQPGGSYNVDYTTNTATLYARWQEAELLWDKVAEEWTTGGSRLQTNDTGKNTGIKAPITKANSGVFKYNSSVFGDDTDAEKEGGDKYNIYYFRGILDSDLDGTRATYGSNGDGVLWPNYVKLGDTCWRIVRTTGSGGVKMVYNGLYSTGTTANSCANATDNAQITTSPFNNNSATVSGKSYAGLQYQNIHATGYTYSSLAASTTTATAVSTIFGATGNDTTTNTNSSIIKQLIEDWYSTNLSSYTNILEPNAGYCNDRTLNEDTSWTTPLGDSNTIIPYGTSGLTVYYFGSYIRNMTATKPPTLNCPRGIVDIYSTTTSNDKNNGNGQLTYPIALLTADEVSFAGSGSSTASQGSAYHANSYLRSGSDFWLLSPYRRPSSGYAIEFRLASDGYLHYDGVNSLYGVRPAISLDHETTIESGNGTATSPWVMAAP